MPEIYVHAVEGRTLEQKRALVRDITAGQSSVFVEVPVVRLQTLGGVLVDDETRQPIAGLAIELIGSSSDPLGGLVGTKAVSGPDGRFAIPDVARGEYFLRIVDQPASSIGAIAAKALEGDGRDKSPRVLSLSAEAKAEWKTFYDSRVREQSESGNPMFGDTFPETQVPTGPEDQGGVGS